MTERPIILTQSPILQLQLIIDPSMKVLLPTVQSLNIVQFYSLTPGPMVTFSPIITLGPMRAPSPIELPFPLNYNSKSYHNDPSLDVRSFRSEKWAISFKSI